MCSAFAVAAVFAGCDDAGAAGAGDANAADIEADTRVPDTTVVDSIGGDADPTEVQVGPRACCLTMEGDLVVWSDDGDLKLWNAATNHEEALVLGPGIQKDPVLEGGTLVWADNRGGDFDLWTMQLTPTRTEPRLLRGGPGDQDDPVIDGTRLVWIGRDAEPHTAHEAEVYTMDLAVAGSEQQITHDTFEQTEPDVSGPRIVWADFTHASAGAYIDQADPLLNNADIEGWDLDTQTPFVVTEEPTKQLRPAIDGDRVVWLDWRGINPEPKYSEFQIFGRRLSDTGPDAEKRLAWSAWSRPDLWRRPAVVDDVAVFIAEPSTPGAGYTTGLLAVSLDGGEPWLLAGSASVLDSLAVAEGKAAYVGAGAIGRVELHLQQR